MKNTAGKSIPFLFGDRRLSIAVVLLLLLLAFAFAGLINFASAPGGDSVIGNVAGWKIEIESSGGFSGKGVGGISVGSDGKASASSEVRRGCQDRLSSEEIKTIEKLISQAKPGKWRKSYARPGNPRGYADQFLYTLKMSITTTEGAKTGGAQSYETSWYDETRDTLPPDLDSLVKELWKIRDRVIAKC